MSTSTSELRWALGDERDFAALADDWRRLEHRHRYRSVFLSHGWLDAAWQWRRQDAQLSVATLSGAGDLRAALVLQRQRTRLHKVPVRCLQCLTVPDSQEVDLLCDQRHEVAVAMALPDLLQQLQDWDVLELKPLRADAMALACLPPALAATGLRTRIDSAGDNPVVPLAGGWERYYSSRSRRLKKGNNLIANRLRRKYQRIELQELPLASREERALARRLLTDISADSWKAQQTSTCFDQPGPGRFLERLLARLGDAGRVRAWVLSLDGRAAAAELQLDDGETLSALRADFRQALQQDSPGSYLNWKLLEHLFTERDGLYRMGPGANAYKARWQVTAQPLQRLLVFNATIAGRAAWVASRWRQALAERPPKD